MSVIAPGNYWVIHNDIVIEVELVELNGSPYGSYMYCKKFQCVFYIKDIYQSRMEAISNHNKKIVSEIERLESYISSQRGKLLV